MTEHVRGDWTVLRDGGSMIAQGYKCSCGVIGCQQSQPMTEPQIPADVQERLDEIEREWWSPVSTHKLSDAFRAVYRLGLSQREAQPLPLPQGELSSDLRQLAMDMGPFWAGVLDSAAMHLDQHAQREAQLRALVVELREAIEIGLQEVAAGRYSQAGCDAQRGRRSALAATADKIDALLTPQEPEP